MNNEGEEDGERGMFGVWGIVALGSGAHLRRNEYKQITEANVLEGLMGKEVVGIYYRCAWLRCPSPSH